MALTRISPDMLNTTTEFFSAPMVVLHQGATQANVDVGFLFNRAQGLVPNVALYWSESTQSIVTAFTNNTGITNSNISVTGYANLTVGNVLLVNAQIYANGVPGLAGQFLQSTSTGMTWSNGTPFTGGYVSNAVTVGSTLLANSGVASTSTSTGALQVIGGAGISGNLYIGGNLSVAGNINNVNYETILYTEVANVLTANTLTVSGNVTGGNVIGTVYSPTVNINSTLGGYNVLNITGAALPAYGSQTWSFFTQNIRLTGGAGSWILFPDSSTQTTAYPGTLLSGTSTLAISTLNAATIGNTNAALTGSSAVITGTANSTGTSSGALQVVGGVGVGGNVYVGGNVVVTGNVISGAGNITVQSFTGNSGQFYGNAAGFSALYAGIPSGYAATPDTIIQSAGNFNSYVQNNSQNINAGSQATTDWVATASNGSDTIYYIDLGIAGGGYSNASPYNSLGTSLWPNDAYLYAQGNVAGAPGGNLVVGTSIPGTVTRILAGGVNSSNVVAIFSNTGLTVSGNVISSNVYTNGLFWAGNGNVIQTGGGSGGSITYTANTAPPATGNTVGSQWYNTSTDTLYEYEYDGTTYHWVDISSPTLATNVNLISGNLTVTGNLFVQSNTASGTVTRVEYNIPHPFLLMGAT
jgi:hypothetical protein